MRQLALALIRSGTCLPREHSEPAHAQGRERGCALPPTREAPGPLGSALSSPFLMSFGVAGRSAPGDLASLDLGEGGFRPERACCPALCGGRDPAAPCCAVGVTLFVNAHP